MGSRGGLGSRGESRGSASMPQLPSIGLEVSDI
jgi:hypothetical protein